MTLLTRKDFHFDLPEQLIAHQALAERDASRMMIREKSGLLIDAAVKDLPTLLPRNTLLILNNTKVFPSRLVGSLDSGARTEIFLLELNEDLPGASRWTGLGKPFRKFRPGKGITFAEGLTAEILNVSSEGAITPTVSLRFNLGFDAMHSWLQKNGIVPLPPYIKREAVLTADESPDTARYQTVYAKDTGSVAAPTAGLHLTPQLLERLEKSGIEVAYTCLHVGAGTFLPVKTDAISEHKMHVERFNVPESTLTAILDAKKARRPIVGVGTTSLRAIESLARKFPDLASQNPAEVGSGWHETDLFIYPETRDQRHKMLYLDGILTNFHQPESTLLMLIAALVGFDEVMKAYRWAIERKYRFYSYGDCSLLWF